ncbi:hypothetical protein AKO1_004098 [Acrasis kona]|uniref:F-box domain-containing protein n=1 Tax=Acrasis kona TaxID=1008807 RepID=A0AAW2Z8T1_9EUKA
MSQSYEAVTSLNDVPEEIFQSIISYLGHIPQFLLRSVSHSWKRQLESFISNTKHLDITSCEGFRLLDPREKFKSLTSLRALDCQLDDLSMATPAS